MDEYEIRLTVQHSESLVPIVEQYSNIEYETVFYAKPHFRFKEISQQSSNIDKVSRVGWETKRVVGTEAVYFDDTWFRWVHSVETPFEKWSTGTIRSFLHSVGNYQHPFRVEKRIVAKLNSLAKLYTFRESKDLCCLVFEWECPFDPKASSLEYNEIFKQLYRYRNIYKRMMAFTVPPYELKECLSRKPVTCIRELPQNSKECLLAHKLDGVFGLVFSYPNKVKEKWEDYERVTRQDVTLGNGFVFAAEKLMDPQTKKPVVVLLDVYQVRGHPTAEWCRRNILTEYLPRIQTVPGYAVQNYAWTLSDLPESIPYKTDGWIVHNVESDMIYKWKTIHSIDLVYYRGYFWLPNGRIACSDDLEDGCVYEISTQDGSVIRKRTDRFKGNSAKQLENIMQLGWNGPAVQPLPVEKKKRLGKKRQS